MTQAALLPTSVQSTQLPQVQSFDSPIFGSIRTLEKEGQPWFVAKDVAEVLGYTRPADAIRKHCKGVGEVETPSAGGPQRTKIIPERDLYRLVMRSKLPAAEQFEEWVVGEVLPSIRKHGGYIAQQESLSAEQVIANALLVAQRVIEEKTHALSQATSQLEQDRPKVVFADSVAVCQSTILVGELAKLIKQATGLPIGQKRLFDWLRDNGFLHKKGSNRNMPTQRSMEMQLFVIKEGTRIGSTGECHITKTTKVTGKGQIYFINRFHEQGKLAKEVA